MMRGGGKELWGKGMGRRTGSGRGEGSGCPRGGLGGGGVWLDG